MIDVFAPTARDTLTLIDKQQVDVGGKIQLAATELAHAEHQQAQGRTLFVISAPETRLEMLVQPGDGACDHGIGKSA